MRGVIWEKDDFFPYNEGRLDMDPVIVEIPDKEIPLSEGFDHNRQPIGKVDDIRLEDGEITGDLTFFGGEYQDRYVNLSKDGLVRLGGFYLGVELDDEKKNVLSCRLASVAVVVDWRKTFFPKASLEGDMDEA